MVIFLFVFWGLLGDGYKFIAITSILAWGPGDAMATIIGKKYGKHKLKNRLIDGEKSIEGTAAMTITSFACTLACLLVFSSLPLLTCIGIAIFVAPMTAAAELYTPKGFDALSVPGTACLTICAILFI